MSKKSMTVVLAVVLLLMAGCAKKNVETLQLKAPKETEQPASPVVQATPEATAAPVETEVFSGVEDSIFDDEPAQTAASSEAKPTQEGKQPESTPAQTKAPDDADEPDDATATPEATKDNAPTATPSPTKEPADSATPTPKPMEEPKQTPPASGGNGGGSSSMGYEEFQNMDPVKQQEHMNSFDDLDAFFDWYNSAKAEYDAAHPDIEIGDGPIDLGEIMGGNN